MSDDVLCGNLIAISLFLVMLVMCIVSCVV